MSQVFVLGVLQRVLCDTEASDRPPCGNEPLLGPTSGRGTEKPGASGRRAGLDLLGVGGLELGGVAAGAGALGVRVVDREARLLESVDPVDLGARKIGGAHLVDTYLEVPERGHHVVVHLAVVKVQGIAEPRAAARLDRNPERVFLILVLDASGGLLLEQTKHLGRSRLCDQHVSGCFRCNRHSYPPCRPPPARCLPTFYRFPPSFGSMPILANVSGQPTIPPRKPPRPAGSAP